MWTNKGRSLFYSSLLCNYNQKTIACTHFKSYNAHRSWTFSFFTKKKSVGAIAMDGNNRFLLKKVCFWITILLASGSILCSIPFYSLVGWNNRIITNRFFPFLDVRCWSFSHAQRLGGGYTYTQQNNILSTTTTDAKTALTQHKITDKSPQHFSRVRRGGGLWVVFFFSGDGWDDGWMKLLFFFFFQVLFSCIVVLLLLQHWIYRADDGCRGFLRALLLWDRSNSSYSGAASALYADARGSKDHPSFSFSFSSYTRPPSSLFLCCCCVRMCTFKIDENTLSL